MLTYFQLCDHLLNLHSMISSLTPIVFFTILLSFTFLFGNIFCFRESVRDQVEIEVYVPLRTVVSRLLVNGWRHEDMEVHFKMKVSEA